MFALALASLALPLAALAAPAELATRATVWSLILFFPFSLLILFTVILWSVGPGDSRHLHFIPRSMGNLGRYGITVCRHYIAVRKHYKLDNQVDLVWRQRHQELHERSAELGRQQEAFLHRHDQRTSRASLHRTY